MYVRSLVLASLLPLVTSYLPFQKRIPNGDKVSFSCKPGNTWPGVGHLNDEGSGPRNPFGRDFEAAGYRWTKELCYKDSDKDGLYNGLELGDPNCNWKKNTPVEMADGLSHPGICDPCDSQQCDSKRIISQKYEDQGEWMADVCKSDGLVCPALHEKGVMNVTARLPEGTPVPPQKTFYICRTFSLYDLGIPRDVDLHVVAVTPVLGNKQVVHHMALFACTGFVKAKEEPYACQIFPSPMCQNFMHVWSMGMNGECYYPDSGLRLGKGEIEFVVIQYHWTNYEERTDLTDSSGLVLHFTRNLRQPLELYPGDSIVTTCGFNTMSRDEDISWGDGTYDEMCFGFITYYPKQNLRSPVCIEIMGLGLCETNSMEGCQSLRDFIHEIGSTRAFKEISYECTNPTKCEPDCTSTIIKHMKREPCMRGNIWRFIQDELAKASGPGYEFLSRIAPCKSHAEKAIRDDPDVKRSN